MTELHVQRYVTQEHTEPCAEVLGNKETSDIHFFLVHKPRFCVCIYMNSDYSSPSRKESRLYQWDKAIFSHAMPYENM